MKTKTKSARQIKQEKVTALVEKISKAKTISFANYHGLSAEQLARLRIKIKNAGGEFLVEKNTLLSRALQDTKYKIQNTKLTGPTAATFAYDDEISPIKEITESQKELGSPIFKFGFLDSKILDAEALENLAKIPSRDDLHATLVGSLASPIYGIVNVLQANIRNLIYVFNQAAKAS